MSSDISPITIVDYGVGNLFNLQRALAFSGIESRISSERKDIENAAKLIFPGVGAFEAGMENLRQRKLIDLLKDYAKSGRSILGICLGMQLLMDESEENGRWKGLGIVPGRVVKFSSPVKDGNQFKIPQIGWNELQSVDSKSWNGSVLETLQPGVSMYFVHSFHVIPQHRDCWLSSSHYGNDTFCSALQFGSVQGVQFHPERSAAAGLALLKQFGSTK